MSENEKRITAHRTIDASAKEIFELLADPARHPEVDGTGTVRSVDRGEPITRMGDTFVMNMHQQQRGDYQMLNTVVGFAPHSLIAWQPGLLTGGQSSERHDRPQQAGDRQDGQPGGWEWVWELDSLGSDRTEVTLTYDWSRVDDPAILKRVHFPVFGVEDLEGSLAQLASAVRAV